jgi:EAL domain-containing protein (putative c-di-GMP-specific phosphodiesterase class I)/CheY-like chemotaxis protein
MSNATGLKRILIFDDDSDFRKLLLLRLGKMFENVELEEYDPIASGVPDLDFDWSRYDILLLDYYLCIHGVTGLDILRQNRKNQQFPVTIMLTGAGNEEVAVRALKSGVADYISKEKLNKEELRKAIIDAYEESEAERQRVNEATLHSHAFNKALFYQQLEPPFRDEYKRILLLIQLDANEQLSTGSGVIVRDNVVRHIAKQTFEVFQIGDCNPSITRFSEISIALLIDDPGSQETLEFNLQGLCSHLKKRPYKFDDRKFRFTVSIGVISIATHHESVDVITKLAKAAVDRAASQQNENSYEIASESQAVVAPVQEEEAAETSATVSTESDEESSITIDESAHEPAPDVSADAGATLTTVEEEAETSTTVPDEVAFEQEQEEDSTVEEPAPEPIPEPEPVPLPEPTPEPELAPAPEPTPEPKQAEVKPADESAEQTPAKPEATPAAKKVEEKATSPDAEKKAPPRKSDEAILDDATLNTAALELKKSFEDKRVVQTFQPVISLFAAEDEDVSELYSTSLQLIDTDGSSVSAEEIFSQVGDIPAFMKYIDRWMLREAIGRSVHSSHDRFIFLMKISDASLADTTLFNWLRELLSGLGKSHPGRAVVLEISSEAFSSRLKQAEALMTYLRKSHGFKFMLDHLEDLETLRTLTDKVNFDLLKVSPDMIKQLSEETSGDAKEGGSLLSSLKSRGAGIIAQDVEDATTLTEVISTGADYAIGEFIGEASSQLDDMNNVESFEIS